ncbi:DUF2199 domain-containing protein [Flavobacterium sp. MAH-1]|uniref:DUF2199 domain-containing protein n=1 Tax=Flavobacterium agri TaxID=2743471 RepID=A0A7Y9C6X2_9FLAO|nr:DUF2199 domain-containing protein [Flavobacterium agri]NUY82728.1 DUF2199 domain-containing protein [Flavobacterium agri]NYA72751.1 DUF2199 domain-containing protein [Flavobacterium agri]
MEQNSKFICSSCGKEHEEWPALAFYSPDNYDVLSEEDKKNIAEISSDFCTINHPNQIDRFIRCTLLQKVNDHCEDLQYGLWVSLSEKSFEDYKANFENENYETQYFGWLCNDILGYTFEESIPTTVVTQTGGIRPAIFPHENFEHEFVKDFYNGISKNEAERRIAEMIDRTSSNEKSKKDWWKFW